MLAQAVSEGRRVVERIRIDQHSIGGLLWAGGWLFTIGFLQMTFWRGMLALLPRPYYLGLTLSSVLKQVTARTRPVQCSIPTRSSSDKSEALGGYRANASSSRQPSAALAAPRQVGHASGRRSRSRRRGPRVPRPAPTTQPAHLNRCHRHRLRQ